MSPTEVEESSSLDVAVYLSYLNASQYGTLLNVVEVRRTSGEAEGAGESRLRASRTVCRSSCELGIV